MALGWGSRFRGGLRDIDKSIAVLAVIAFISQVGVSIMLPLLPLYAVQLGASPTELGLMVSIFAVTQTVGQLGSGAIIGRIPARRQMPLGQASYAAANFLIATATSAVPLILWRSIAGFGGGLSIIAERLYIARVADRARLAFTNGVVSAAGSSGSVLGPTLGAVLALRDLRVPFIVVGCTATLAAIAAVLFLPPERVAPAAVAAVPEAVEDVPGVVAAADRPEPVGAASETTGAATSMRPAEPEPSGAMPQTVVGRPPINPLVAIFLWSLCFNAAYGGWITTFAPYATQRLDIPASQVSLMFAFFGIGAILLGPYLGRVADRSGRRRMVGFGTLLVLLNIASLLVAAPLALIYGSAILAGAGLAGAQSSWFALLGVATDGGRRGRSFGFVTALSNLGVVVGASLASTVWQVFGLHEGLLSASAFLVLGVLSLLLIQDDRPSGRAARATPAAAA
jgi:MFS family permease